MDLWELFADRDDTLVLEVRPCRRDLGLRDFELLLLEVSPSVFTGRVSDRADPDLADETLSSSFELKTVRRVTLGRSALREVVVDRAVPDLPEAALSSSFDLKSVRRVVFER